MRTRLTELLEIEHPVMLAGMGGVSYHRLAAAVSEAGGFGCLGASTMTHQEMIEEMAKVRELTAKPFGVDLLTAIPGQVAAQIADVIKGGARVFVAGLGVPRDAIDLLHDNNVLVGSMCGKVRHATSAVESGCDFVVAQGTEAGGHTGTVATMALVPQVVDAVGERVPVVAAGGLFDGRGLAASLSLGADGVWIGTRFIATPGGPGRGRLQGDPGRRCPRTAPSSAGPTPARPAASSATTGPSTSRSTPRSCSPSPSRPWTRPRPAPTTSARPTVPRCDVRREFFPCGQGVGAIDELVPAGELVARMVVEAEAVLDRLSRLPT